jgi:hypothetical protein
MGERHAERTAGAKYSIDLTQHSIEVFGTGKGVDRQRKVDLVGTNEGQIGKIAVVQFDLHLVDFGQLAGGVDAGNVVVDGNDMGTGEGQAHGVVPESDPELQDLFALGSSNELQRIVARKVGAPRDSVERKLGSTGE